LLFWHLQSELQDGCISRQCKAIAKVLLNKINKIKITVQKQAGFINFLESIVEDIHVIQGMYCSV
jgi:hypothetical protein